MSSKVGLVKPNDHIVVVQMISDSLVVKASFCLSACRLRAAGSSPARSDCALRFLRHLGVKCSLGSRKLQQ